MIPAEKIARIDHFKQKAIDLAPSDQIGSVLARAMEAMLYIVKNSTSAKNLGKAARSLDMERRMMMEDDEERDSPLREIVYGMCESLGITIEAIVEERKREDERKQETPAPEVPQAPPQIVEPFAARTSSYTLARQYPFHQSFSIFAEPSVDMGDTVKMEEEQDDNPMGDLAVPAVAPDAGPAVRVNEWLVANQPQAQAYADALAARTEPPRRFGCSTCGKKFAARNTLATHELIHAGKRPHKCPQCDYEFMRRSDMIRHLKTVDHSIRSKMDSTSMNAFRCSQCEMGFSRMADLTKHSRSMHGAPSSTECE